MTTARAFRGFRFPAEIILWAVRWYLRFGISYRDLEAMLADNRWSRSGTPAPVFRRQLRVLSEFPACS